MSGEPEVVTENKGVSGPPDDELTENDVFYGQLRIALAKRMGLDPEPLQLRRKRKKAKPNGENGEAVPPLAYRAEGKPAKARLTTAEQLDGRTKTKKLFNQLVRDIETDLGGRDRLSAIEKSLVQAFVGSTVMVSSLNAKLLCGERVSLPDHATCVSSMVRVASRLGLRRRARDVVENLGQYLAQNAANDIANDVEDFETLDDETDDIAAQNTG